MKTIHSICTIALASLLFACNKKQAAHAEYPVTYQVDYVKDETFDWLSHIDIEEVVPLEFSDSSMISIAQDCQVTEDKILIQDHKQHCLFVFDRQGNYLYAINNIGNGPGEYLDIRSFCLNDERREIIVNDGYKLLFYDLKDGTFHYSTPLKLTVDNPTRNAVFFSCVNPSKDTYYLWTDMADCTLYKYDGKEMTGLKPRTHYQLVMKKFLPNYKGDYLYCPDYGEFGVSTIDGEKRFYISFGKDELPSDMRPKDRKEAKEVEKTSFFKAIMNVQEAEKGIYISALSPKTNYYDIYIDKATKRMWKGEIDMDGYLNVVQVKGNSFYALFYPHFADDASTLKKALSAHNVPGDNPMLIKFHMKDMDG